MPGSILKAQGTAAQLLGSLFFKIKLILGQSRNQLLLQPEISPGIAPGTGHPVPDPAPAFPDLGPGRRFLPMSNNKVSYFGEEKSVLCYGQRLPKSATYVCALEGQACVTSLPHQGQNLNNLDSCPGSPGQGSFNCRKRRLWRVYVGNHEE